MARHSPVRYPQVDFSGLDLNEEITPVRVAADDVIYVAVGKDLKENERNLKWAIQKSNAAKICILHVHSPALKIPIMGTKFSIDQLAAQSVRAYHENERRDMQKILEKYVLICARAGVRADTLVIEKDSIERGIVELISQHGIEKLVMGAATNKCYSKKMTGLKSKKAIYVRLQAPTFCCIWFVCKGNLIYTRERESERPDTNSLLLSIPVSPDTDILLRSRSATEDFNEQVDLMGSFTEYPRVVSYNHRINFSELSSGRTPQTNFESMSSDRSSDGTPRGSPSPSVASQLSSSSSVETVGDSPGISVSRTQGNDTVADSYTLHHINLDHQSSPPSIQEENLDGEPDELYDMLMKYVAEAEKARREAFEESIKRRKAEKDAIDARRRLKESETIYADELRQRREMEEALAKGKEEAAQVKSQLKKIMEDLQAAEAEKSLLEAQLQNSDTAVQELEQKIFSAVGLLQKYRKERDELEAERDDVLKSAEALREQHSSRSSNTSPSILFADFYFYEIENATRNFDPALKIGEGGYGSIYKGFLRHTQVAIKMLHPNSLQGPSEFQQEVNILSKLRHPNIVTLIGACPEAWTLVYEYLQNGSLEDRLNCKDNTPPLSWQTRIRIATELCCALIFLHSCTARGIIHGDLKPANILLDANFVSKLSDFGICRVLSEDDNSTTLCHRSDPKGTFAYMDPEFLQTGELIPKSDVYSFGIILLRLLTGRPAMGITKEIQYALDKGNLKDLLDPTAGDWPFVQAKQLAHLAMSCCERNRSTRPDLSSEVWKVLEPMRASCGTSSFRLNSDERCDIPSYFVCPIFQEVMQDPVIAADGFTYEAEALRGWLDSGHNTSPMTNLAIEHKNLVPNHALRSAIQEWLHQH